MAIEDGKKVGIHYTLTVDGQVVDSSAGKDPLTYTQGSMMIIPGLEKEIKNMKVGDKKTVTVTPEEGYGQRDPAAVHKVPRTAFKDVDNMQVGGVITGESQGQKFQAMIVALDDKEVTLDMNHPLAGKTLTFEVELVGVE